MTVSEVTAIPNLMPKGKIRAKPPVGAIYRTGQPTFTKQVKDDQPVHGTPIPQNVPHFHFLLKKFHRHWWYGMLFCDITIEADH